MIKNRICFMLVSFMVLIGLAGCGGQVTTEPVNAGNSNGQLASLSLTPTNPAAATGTSQDFTAVGIYSDGTTRDMTASIVWSSSDTSVAEISGLVTAAAVNAPTYQSKLQACRQSDDLGELGRRSRFTVLTVTAAQLVAITITPTNRASQGYNAPFHRHWHVLGQYDAGLDGGGDLELLQHRSCFGQQCDGFQRSGNLSGRRFDDDHGDVGSISGSTASR